MATDLYIKNMVCDRCKMAVDQILRSENLTPTKTELGHVQVAESISSRQEKNLDAHLRNLGFELLSDKRSKQIEKIKTCIIQLVQQQDGKLEQNLSDYLQAKLHTDYSALSHAFSELEGTTIEKYFIAQKIEKVKELLVYDEMTLSEIAYRLHYSSVAHLSNQFKKVTGLTPTYFRKIGISRRKSIDQL